MHSSEKKKNYSFGHAEMAQQIKAFADQPDNLGLIPGTHVEEGENCCLLISVASLACAPPDYEINNDKTEIGKNIHYKPTIKDSIKIFKVISMKIKTK